MISGWFRHPHDGKLLGNQHIQQGALFLHIFITRTLQGIANYLHANSFGNANQDDLWAFLTAVGQEDGTFVDLTVKEVMDTWTVQMGYPVVTFTRWGAYGNIGIVHIISRVYGASGGASVHQERFLLNPSDRTNSTDEHEYKW